MRIVCIGGGPAGLYFALLMKKANRSHAVTVIERNRPDDTFGWGVVFSDQTMGNLATADPETHDLILDSFNHWNDIDVHFKGRTITSSGHGFSGIARRRLLNILQERCEQLGVNLVFQTEVSDDGEFADADLIIASDGANSVIRRKYAEYFKPNIEKRNCKFVWLGTHKAFEAFTFAFEETEWGWFQAHAYKFDHNTSTFIVETPEENWLRDGGYGGRGHSFPFGGNVHDVPIDDVASRQFDCVLFQLRRNFEVDQHQILSPAQRKLPRIYLEHDPPQEHPTEQRHWVDDPNILLVHVTPFNALMWDSGSSPVRVIDHGVIVPDDVEYSGHLERGIVVVNNLRSRGRRLGVDVFEQAREQVPLDLVGMGAEELGGLGEIPPPRLCKFTSQYRFFFNPIRYTSLGLAVIEAMTIGMPIVGLATTEMATAIENGASGFVDTDLNKLVARMHELNANPAEARRLGQGARRAALERFSIGRFVADWERTLAEVVGRPMRKPIHAMAERAGAT
jgi:2-polyprenyl-6-methoxyphenol hydroxylase-like FAD-dependent oxidoreductase